jgi:HK97 family phage portal protein
MAKKKSKTRAEPGKTQSFLCSMDAYDVLCCSGYTKLSQNPEIMSGVNKIADLVSSMTIYLMANTTSGDTRIKNELSKKIDIHPNQYMTRKSFISTIVRTLLLEGDGNCVVAPITRKGLIDDLVPLEPGMVSFVPDGYGYEIVYQGKSYDSAEMLHFTLNPDPHYPWMGTGYRVTLREVAETLSQASKTKKGFMESKWKPSVVLKVDGLTDEFANKEGRSKLLEQYIESAEAGEPWMIPSEQFDVKEIRPLSLNDIALPESVRLDKKTVAAILDIPSFVVGEGEFQKDVWNNFVNTRIRTLCNVLEQEMTRKLLLSPDLYFKFNLRSLYAYDIDTLSNVGANMYTRGIMTGNEVRDWIGLSPKEGLDELIILENYIPAGMIGDQKKLIQEGGDKDA